MTVVLGEMDVAHVKPVWPVRHSVRNRLVIFRGRMWILLIRFIFDADRDERFRIANIRILKDPGAAPRV